MALRKFLKRRLIRAANPGNELGSQKIMTRPRPEKRGLLFHCNFRLSIGDASSPPCFVSPLACAILREVRLMPGQGGAMGHRTLTLDLVLRALFLDTGAYNAMRDDDNPFVEGAFLVVILGAFTALLSLVGQLVAWASTPSISAIRDIILSVYQQQPWWGFIANNPAVLAEFMRIWDIAWRILPPLFGAPDPAGAAFNVLVWPFLGLVSWLVYGLLAHLFARLLHGAGTLNQTLGTTALAAAPLMLRGLGFIPFITLGSVLSTWQLICRYKALRSVHRFSWQRAFWSTVLPFGIYALLWLLLLVGIIASVERVDKGEVKSWMIGSV